MKRILIPLSLCLTLTACAAGSGGGDDAGTYPEKGSRISLEIPLSPGGTTDTWARVLADGLSRTTDARFQVVNDTSAGGLATYNQVIDNPEDTSVVTDFNLPAGLKYLYPDTQAGFTKKSFAPVGCMGYTPNVLVVNADSEYQTLDDLVQAAKASPGSVTAAADGALSDDTVFYANLENEVDAEFNVAVVDGSSQKVTALLGKRVDFFSGGITGVQAQVDSGDFRVLAVLADKRSKFLSDVPTAQEEGVDVTSDSYFCLAMGAGAPASDRKGLESAMRQLAEDPAFKKANSDVSMEVRFLDGDQMSTVWSQQEELVRDVVDTIQ
jgi:tripartite-type tricarboxylate transporter receptor subunit TctC